MQKKKKKKKKKKNLVLIDMCYEIVHFCIPKFKIESVKSK